MHYSALAILTAIAGLASAAPSAPLDARCGSYLAPDSFFVLDESRPDQWLPSGQAFHVSQAVGTNGGEFTRCLLTRLPACLS